VVVVGERNKVLDAFASADFEDELEVD